MKSFTICPPERGAASPQEVIYLSKIVYVRLTRQAWVELPDPLFSYELVTDTGDSSTLDGWCPSEVTIGDEVEFLFSSTKISDWLSSSFDRCEMRIRPKFYDSVILVTVQDFNKVGRDLNITLTGFDPSDPDESPLKQIEVFRKNYNYNFTHMAVKIHALVPMISRTSFRIYFQLNQESQCTLNEYPYPTDQFQYIVSPNYPHPYPRNLLCVWRFTPTSPMHFELVEYRGSESCRDDSLRIIFRKGTVKTFG
ncbi:hypothetical protein ElyMa_005125700 [Elysia marginata]|uniref:CUB domain-containing protein n=1 Tax=Elysia marginata TaxID=1093978 RepID=A0AAV4JN31_9GAST|nr:hypothetical protein ElyMa_005125700 [Elysia marginata]